MEIQTTQQAWPGLPSGALEDEVRHGRCLLEELGWPADEPCGAACLHLWLASPFCREAILDEPGLWRAFWEQALPIGVGQIRQRLHDAVAGCAGQEAQHDLHLAIRREHVAIAACDILGKATLEEVFAALCALQEEAVVLALQLASTALPKPLQLPRDDHGQPVPLVVLALGKLGGREPNFSSDLDVLFAFADEACSRDGTLDLGHVYTKIAQRLIKILNDRTMTGGYFRIDTRLRPFGSSGPLVMSCTALERYYEEHGREWERCALIRLRPLTGQGMQPVQALLEQLRPFVYRKYLDYGAIAALRDVQAMISHQALRRGAADNIKIGPGGIRMVEFVVQVQQLIHGGRNIELQQGCILEALQVLREQRLLPLPHVQALEEAYRLLRTLENRLQEMQAQQVHTLPQTGTEQLRLAYAMGWPDWQTLATRLDAVRHQVMTIFAEVFATAPPRGKAAWHEELRLIWKEMPGNGQCAEVLERIGFKEAAVIQGELMSFQQSRFVMRLPARGRQWLEQLIPEILLQAAPFPTAALQHKAIQRLFSLLQAIGQRSGYLALLAEHPQVLQRLMRLIMASDWIFQAIARQPVLLDELLHPVLVDRHGVQQECEAILRRQQDHGMDLEQAMDALREIKERAFLSVATAQLDGCIDALGVGETLSAIAQSIVHTAFIMAQNHWYEPGKTATPPLVVIGYGRLGAGELGYASDLDLVFLSDGMDVMQATALVRRLIHLLSTRTRAGIAFQVDTRLRPSGRAGLLIGTLDGFADYQWHHAWLWEHLALVHSRCIAGDEALQRHFEALRKSILAKQRSALEVWQAVSEMRQRLAVALEGRDELKRGPGGLLDVRFMAAGLVLIHGAAHPALLEPRGVVPLLRCMQKLAIVPPQELERLIADYIQLLEAEQRQTLQGAPIDGEQSAAVAAMRARLAGMWDNTPWLRG